MVVKLGKYFKQVGYRCFETSNDVKYCLFTHHNIVYPLKQQCICCGGCCGSNGCQTPGCNTLPKCGIKAISIWQLIGSLFGIYWLIAGLSLFSSSFLVGFLSTVYTGFGTYCHIASAIYGLQLTSASDGISFHKCSHMAMIHYAALAGIYYLAFVIIAPIWIVYVIFYGTTLSGITFCLAAYISYLPFEAIRLIDSNAKWETCTARRVPNAINLNNIKFATAGAGTRGGAVPAATDGQETKQ